MDEIIRIAARAYEQDRYLSALLAPRPARRDLIILYAFAGEIGRIASTVSDPMIAQIRLHWWREAILSAEPTGHPIADAMADLARRRKLPADMITGMIDAEDNVVQGTQIPAAADLTAFLAQRDGALFVLAWQIRTGRPVEDVPPDLAAAGQIYGRARLLVECAAHAFEGRTMFPADELAAAGIVNLPALAGHAAPVPLLKYLDNFRRDTVARWQPIKAGWRSKTTQLRDVLLPLALVEPYLSAHQRLGVDVLCRTVEITPLKRVVRLWLARRLALV